MAKPGIALKARQTRIEATATTNDIGIPLTTLFTTPASYLTQWVVFTTSTNNIEKGNFRSLY
jgi:hypothetical protein